jgi:hypothetical protein
MLLRAWRLLPGLLPLRLQLEQLLLLPRCRRRLDAQRDQGCYLCCAPLLAKPLPAGLPPPQWQPTGQLRRWAGGVQECWRCLPPLGTARCRRC